MNFVAQTLLIEGVSGVRHLYVSDTDLSPTHVITFKYVIFLNYYRCWWINISVESSVHICVCASWI